MCIDTIVVHCNIHTLIENLVFYFSTVGLIDHFVLSSWLRENLCIIIYILNLLFIYI